MWGKVTAAGQSAPQCPQPPGMLLFPSPPSVGFPADGLGSWQGCCARQVQREEGEPRCREACVLRKGTGSPYQGFN